MNYPMYILLTYLCCLLFSLYSPDVLSDVKADSSNIDIGLITTAIPKPAPVPMALKENDIYEPNLDDGTPWTRSTHLKKTRLSVLLGGFAIGDAIGFAKIADMQYNTETSSFHFHEWSRDIREYKQMDKIGHVVEAYHMSYLSSKIYRWSGLSAKKSIWFGSATGLFWMTQIEVTDGFFKAWGFSYLDYTANIVGAGYSALQQLYPEQLKGIRFKFSFWPSDAYKNDEYSTVSKSILDDYEGFTWWLAFNFHDIMPGRWRKDYPRWLSPFGLAIGQGVQNIATDVFNGQREIFIGLDFDVTKIPTGDSDFLKFLKDEVNFIRLPLPTVRITPRAVFYGIYF